MLNLVIKEAKEDGFETLAEFEFDKSDFVVPEPKQLVELEGDDNDERYFVENVIHRLNNDGAEVQLVVRSEEEVMQELRQRQRQMQKMKQFQQAAQQQGGGNPFGGGGGGGGNKGGGGGSPFTL